MVLYFLQQREPPVIPVLQEVGFQGGGYHGREWVEFCLSLHVMSMLLIALSEELLRFELDSFLAKPWAPSIVTEPF